MSSATAQGDLIPELVLLGVSFRTAPNTVREALAFNRDEAADLLRQAAAEIPGAGVLLLSTCNRTELYVAGDEAARLVYGLLRARRPVPLVGGAPAIDAAASLEQFGRYRLVGADAFTHLVRVACGLESAILGDSQILGQLRSAVRLAEEAGTLGRTLRRLTGAAFRAGKVARRETGISAGSPGIGPAVAALVGDREPIVLLGAGDAARAIGRAVVKAGPGRSGGHPRTPGRLSVCNRSADRGLDLAAELGVDLHPWAELPGLVAEAGAVVVATSARTPVLGPGGWGPGVWARSGDARLLVIDAGFPPQVDPALAGQPEIDLVALEAIRAGDESAAIRSAAVPAVEAIVAATVARTLNRESV